MVKKGTHSAGVAKQYVGCVGKLENAQVGVFLAYASPQGVAFLDRALYLPEEWTDDPARCRQAGIPEDVGFATKPQLAQPLLERARQAGVPAAWVTADSVYGDDRSLRVWLEAQEQPYVLAVSGKEYVNARADLDPAAGQHAAHRSSACRPRAGSGSRRATGRRGRAGMTGTACPSVPPLQEGFERWCLVRRSLAAPDGPAGLRGLRAGRHRPGRRWCGWRAGAGRLRWPSSRPRARWGSTTTRCAAGRAGIAT